MLYNEKTATSYTRSNAVTIRNPHPSTDIAPSMTFHEEHVLTGLHAKGVSLVPDAGNVTINYSPEALTEEFDLIHPETGEVLGKASLMDLQVLLHSLYFHEVTKRDAPPPEAV